MTEWLLIAAGVVLTLGTGVAVAAEFSLVTVERSTIESAAETGDASAARVLKSLRNLSTQLSGAQVAISFTTLLVGYLVEPSLAGLLHGPFEAIGLPPAAVATVTVVLAMFIATMFSMLVGELIPKNLAIARPQGTARWSAPMQAVFTVATLPLIRALNGTANAFIRAIGLHPQEELSAGRTPDELAVLVRHSARAGALDEATATRVGRSLTFGRLTAGDVMVHRVHVETIDHDTTAADVIASTRATGHSRFPVVRDSADEVVGVVHVKRAVAVPRAARGEVAVTEVMDPVLHVPGSLRVANLLVELKSETGPLAVVEDEYGGTAGIVTLEDVVEEVVGAVADEHDPTDIDAVRDADGSWMLAATLRPDEVRARTGLDIPDSPDYDTIAGFVLTQLGRLAEPGDRVPVTGGRLEVVDLDGRHIERLRFQPDEPGSGTDAAAQQEQR
ncbi:MAG: DUF21 domain-containing protein [Streptosporangiales bacterium]|nr:DUF21 domain-containing protein [Streptosporangiales bacterium]